MANIAGKIGMKILTIVVGIPVGIVTKKVLEKAWAAAGPKDRPRKPNEAGARVADAVGWAALSAAGIVAAEIATRKGAEETWRTLIGTEPPPPAPSKAQKKLDKAQKKAEKAGTVPETASS